MPRKVFVAGEILTASDVNTNLMDQTVMVFDDATDRATAIPTPVEGMLTYLEDVGGAQGLEVFDGSVFTPVAIVPDPPGLIALKSEIFTGIQAISLQGGAQGAVNNLSITHSMQNASNKLLISAYFGAASTGSGLRGEVGIAVMDGATLINIGDAAGSRTRVTAGGPVAQSGGNLIVGMPSFTTVYEPGDTASHTYTVRAINVNPNPQVVAINRNANDSDNSANPRATSGLVIQEVAV